MYTNPSFLRTTIHLSCHAEFVEQGITNYEKQIHQTELDKITRWAKKLGLTIATENNMVHQ